MLVHAIIHSAVAIGVISETYHTDDVHPRYHLCCISIHVHDQIYLSPMRHGQSSCRLLVSPQRICLHMTLVSK